ncbi:MAG: acyltransferase [Candidatus Electrothrix sp. AR3]|nr:acyltransferase [Candidatus Electrothrix sp. AR3]
MKLHFIFFSFLKKLLYRSLYENVHFSKDVYLAGGVKITVTDGGSLCIEENGIIDRYVNIRVNGGEVKIGSNLYVVECSYIASSKKVSIGRDALIASHVVIRDNQHIIADLDKPICTQGNESFGVVIGTNVWIGTKASVLPGGSNTLIGAHSLVNKNLESNSIYAGIPCKLIRKR